MLVEKLELIIGEHNGFTNPKLSYSHYSLSTGDISGYFSDPEGDALSFSVVSAFHNGGADKGSSFYYKRTFLRSTFDASKAKDRGYYRMTIRVTDSWGAYFRP